MNAVFLLSVFVFSSAVYATEHNCTAYHELPSRQAESFPVLITLLKQIESATLMQTAETLTNHLVHNVIGTYSYPNIDDLAIQSTLKYNLQLTQTLIENTSPEIVDTGLPPYEHCLLQRILSPISYKQFQGGVVEVPEFGRIQPAVLIATLAATFVPTKKDVNDIVLNNTVSVGIFAQLAPVCFYCDSLRKTSLRLPGWQMHDEAIRSIIDAHALTAQLNEQGVTALQDMRLSQILEMFYSTRGLPETVTTWKNSMHYMMTNNNERISACDRSAAFESLHSRGSDLAYDLQGYMKALANVADLDRAPHCNLVMEFMQRAGNMINNSNVCQYSLDRYQRTVDLTLAIEGTENEASDFIFDILDNIHISTMDSSFSVIHGRTAEFIIRQKNDAVNELIWPSFTKDGWKFNIKKVLHKYLEYLDSNLQPNNFTILNSRMFVIITKNLEVSEEDNQMIRDILEKYDDIHIVIFTKDVPVIELLHKNLKIMSMNNEFSSQEVAKQIGKIISKIPKQFHLISSQNAQCQLSETSQDSSFIDYATPKKMNHYSVIDSEQRNLVIQFKMLGHGELIACQFKETIETCKILKDVNSTIDFHPTFDHPVTYTVALMSKSNYCSYCPYQDQIPFEINVQGLCNVDSSAKTELPKLNFIVIATILCQVLTKYLNL